MVGTGGGNSGLVNGDHSAVGEGLESMGSNLGTARCRGNTGGKNLGMDCSETVLDSNCQFILTKNFMIECLSESARDQTDEGLF